MENHSFKFMAALYNSLPFRFKSLLPIQKPGYTFIQFANMEWHELGLGHYLEDNPLVTNTAVHAKYCYRHKLI